MPTRESRTTHRTSPTRGGDPAVDAQPMDSEQVEPGEPIARPGCPPLPATPRVLVQDPGLRPGRVAVYGEWLYFGAIVETDGPEAPRGGVYRVPVTGGDVEAVEIAAHYLSGPLLVDHSWIAFARAEVSGSAHAWMASYPALIAFERDGGAEIEVDNGGDTWAGTKPFALGADHTLYYGVDWSMEESGLAVHGLRTGETTVLFDDQDVRELVVDGHTAPREGGRPRVISETDTGWLEDVDADGCGVFWAALNPPRILAMARP